MCEILNLYAGSFRLYCLTIVVRDEVQKIVSADAADNKRALSPPSARNTPTRMIHIKNLTRPYIEKQLKELLNKTGTLIEDSDHFWLDSIKSQCVATVS